MKKFIFSVFIFIIIFISFFILFNALFYIYNSNMESNYIVDKSKSILVLGDSHTECAINDSIVIKSVNISKSADAYFYSFIKLRKFLKINSGIKTVILGISEKSLYNKNWLYKPNKANAYFRLMNLNDFRVLLESGGIKTFANLAKASFDNFSKLLIIKKSNYKDMGIGGYLYFKREKLDEAITRYKKQKSIDRPYSEIQVEYLLKIVNLCQEYTVKLILLNTPTYVYCKNENDSEKLEQFINKNIDNSVEYWDYSNYLLPDFCYGDLVHLNYRGAEIFSKKLQNDINRYFYCK